MCGVRGFLQGRYSRRFDLVRTRLTVVAYSFVCYDSAHPTFVSWSTHESPSNLSCVLSTGYSFIKQIIGVHLIFIVYGEGGRHTIRVHCIPGAGEEKEKVAGFIFFTLYRGNEWLVWVGQLVSVKSACIPSLLSVHIGSERRDSFKEVAKSYGCSYS